MQPDSDLLVPRQLSLSIADAPTGHARRACARKRLWLTCLVSLLVAVVVVPVTVIELTKSKGNHADYALPLVKPPVQSATPIGLKGTAKRRGPTDDAPTATAATAASAAPRIQTLDPSSIHERFFSPSPTNLFTILDDVDNRIRSINDRLDLFPCINSTTPVAFALKGWGGPNVTFYAQCSESWSGGLGAGFDMFALVGNAFYMFVSGGETQVAARVTTSGGNLSVVSKVEVWYSVGLLNVNGSHAVVRIEAVPGATPVFEMTVAGTGVGFCGAQLRATSATMNVTGSADTGAVCQAVDSICSTANDTSVAATCGTDVTDFVLPALGRLAYTGPGGSALGVSEYPSTGGNVFLLASGADDTHFGPISPVV